MSEKKHLGVTQTENRWLNDIDFANDLVLLRLTHPDAQGKLDRLQNFAGQIGLNLNESKTEIMDLTNKATANKLNNLVQENIKIVHYLGSKMAQDGDVINEMLILIILIANAYNKLSNIWRSEELNKHTKRSLFNSRAIRHPLNRNIDDTKGTRIKQGCS